MSALWIIIAILLCLLLIWLSMQPKQGAKASNASEPTLRMPDALPSGEEHAPMAETKAVDENFQDGEMSSVSPLSLETEVQQLLNTGQKIAAIKRVRTVKQWGLRDAKDYVDALARNEPPPMPAVQPTFEPTPELRQDVLQLLASHQKVSAVKWVRSQTGWHLHEAKKYVDAIQQEEFQGKNMATSDWPDPALWQDVQALLAADRTFDAVERVKSVTGWELRQALEYVTKVQQSRY